MAPKKGGGGAPEKMEARTTNTAVLLADSFTQSFRPITVERPKVLLPLVNTPMIEYTLEWLALNKIEEVFVFCCAHADQICKYLEASKWSSPSGGMKVVTIVSTNCLSAGEALRVIEQRDVIKGDFVLLSGDVVSNMALLPVLDAHRTRRLADKNAIMTMVMKAVHPTQRLRLGDTDLCVVLDPSSKRLLKYLEYDGDKGTTTVKTDASLFSERDSVQVRCDLMDTHIAICSPEVLHLFSDNFDYQNVKRDFVSGVLSEEELGNKLFVHELGREYAARIHNLRSYDGVSRDIMQRWVFPFVPDTNVLYRCGQFGTSTYRYARGHHYFEANQVHIARYVVLGQDLCIGAGTSIGDHARLTQSVIGRGCRIGKHVDIEGSYLQDNVTVEDGAVLRHALVCEGAVIRAGAVLSPGCVVSYGCVVAAHHQVPAAARVSLRRPQLQAAGHVSDDELEYSAASASSPSFGRGKAAPAAAGAKSGSGSSSSDDATSSSGSSSDDNADAPSPSMTQSREKPSLKAVEAAQAIAAGKPADPSIAFDAEAVGAGGAGYGWAALSEASDAWRYSIAPPSASRPDASTQEEPEEDGDAAHSASGDDQETNSEDSDDAEPEVLDSESVFKREVGETFLRCVKLKFDQTNAVVELNSLKIAENRTFADCARYILTMLLSLCLPIPPYVNAEEYSKLFAAALPDLTSPKGKLALLTAVQTLLVEWTALLRRFLKVEDDQVELLLTLEEFCSGEGAFEADRAQSSVYRAVFPQLLKLLYDRDVLSEEAILAWADEKENAEADDRTYLVQCAEFIAWLRASDSEDDSEENDDDDEEEDEDE